MITNLLQIDIHQPMLHHHFKKKFDLDEPPALEDGSSFGRIRHRGKGSVFLVAEYLLMYHSSDYVLGEYLLKYTTRVNKYDIPRY